MTLLHCPEGLQVLLRDARDTDLNYILATWKRNLSGRRNEDIHKYNKLCDAVIVKQNLSVLVACDPDAEDTILGYAVMQPPSVAWFVRVNEPFRRHGIARALVARLSRPISCPFWGDVPEAIQASHELRYTPSLIKQVKRSISREIRASLVSR